MVEDNVEEVADALNDLTEDLTGGIEIIPPDHVADIADTLENIADVEDPSEEASVFFPPGNQHDLMIMIRNIPVYIF